MAYRMMGSVACRSADKLAVSKDPCLGLRAGPLGRCGQEATHQDHDGRWPGEIRRELEKRRDIWNENRHVVAIMPGMANKSQESRVRKQAEAGGLQSFKKEYIRRDSALRLGPRPDPWG